jgi:hypothetical protein
LTTRNSSSSVDSANDLENHDSQESDRSNYGAHSCGQGQLEFSRPHRDVSSVLSRWDKYEQGNPKQSQDYVAQSRCCGVVVTHRLVTPESRVQSSSAPPFTPVAQMEERLATNQKVGDSSSSRGSRYLMRDSSEAEQVVHTHQVVGSTPTPATIRQAHSSVVEHRPDKAGVESSILSVPTKHGDSSMVERCVYTADVGGSRPSLRTSANGLMVGRQPSKLIHASSILAWRSSRWTHSSVGSELPAHNRLVGGSSPSGSTKIGLPAADLQLGFLNPAFTVQLCAGVPVTNPQVADPQTGLLSLSSRFNFGLGVHRLCAGHSMVEYRSFKAGCVSSILTRRTSRVLKRGLVTQLVECQTLNLEVRSSILREPTIRRSVAKLAQHPSPKREICRFKYYLTCQSVHNSDGRVPACQVGCRGFESRCTLQAPIVQLAEYFLGKEGVAGSIPAWSSIRAGIAQSVEHLTCNEDVGGSIPSASSIRWCSTTVVQGFRKAEVGGSIPSTSSKSCGLVAQSVERQPCKLDVAGSMPVGSTIVRGSVAQMVEQRTENPCVGGSIPPQPTSIAPG